MTDYSISELAAECKVSPNEIRAFMRAVLRRNGVRANNIGGRISENGAQIIREQFNEHLPASAVSLRALEIQFRK